MSKILSIVLTVAILAGLLMMAVPVSAADNGWSIVGQPKVTAATNANVYTIAADGMTMFVYTNTGIVETALWKSTDAGKTWTNTGLDTNYKFRLGNVVGGVNIALTALAVSQTNALYLIATDGTNLYRSVNGGSTFAVFNPTPATFTGGAGLLKSIDIGTGSSGNIAYLVGTTTNVYLYDLDDASGTWLDLGTVGRGWTAGDVALALKFSPNYGSDTTLMAVANTVGVAIRMRTYVTYGDAAAAGTVWNKVGEVQDAPIIAAVTPATSIASIAIPSNFDPISTSYNKVFVGLGDTALGAISSGVYRINGRTTSASTSTLLDTFNVASVAYKGTGTAGTLAVGQYNAPDVLSSTAVLSGNTPNWINSADTMSSPSGAKVNLMYSPTANVLYAGTSAAPTCGLFSSTDYMSFAGLAFIRVGALATTTFGKTKIAGPYMWYVVKDAAAASLLFYSSDSGNNWNMVRDNGAVGIDNLYPSPAFATDKTFYFTQVDTGLGEGKKILKTSDAGATWSKITSPGNVIVSSMSIVDANTYWVGSAINGVQLSTSSSHFALNGEKPLVLVANPAANFFMATTLEGSIWFSSDLGVTFTRLGDAGKFPAPPGPPKAAFNMGTKTIYAQANLAGSDIMYWTVGTSADWQTYIAAANLPLGVNFSSIQLAGGIWYLDQRTDPLASAVPQIYRSTDIKDPTFAGFCAVTNSSRLNIDGLIGTGPQTVVMDTAGNATYYNTVVRDSAPPAGEYATVIQSFRDTLINAPATVSPAANASINRVSDFTWKAVQGNNITYTIQVGYDKEFTSLASATTTTTATTILPQLALTEGMPYFWRIRVETPMLSKWSAAVPITVKLQSNAATGLDLDGRISPTNGATGVATNSALTWGIVNGADSYNLKIASDSAFTKIIEEQNGLKVNVYAPAKPFTANTTYFWEVQSVNGSGTSNWVASAFTTAGVAAGPAPTASAAPVVTPVITVSVPPQATPTYTFSVPPAATAPNATPGYIWVIIVIGAILVIAVIVLIVRTRRV